MVKLVPRNDLESSILAYYEMERPLRVVLKQYQDKCAKGMLTKIANILTGAGYKGGQDPTVILRQADPKTIRTLEEIANKLPDKQRKAMLSKMYGQIGAGNLTVKNAVRDVLQFDQYTNSIDLYDKGTKALRGVAEEAMLRGEYMVQKDVGIGWEVDAPGIKRVDAFLKKQWTQNDATEFLRPMSKIVEEQVDQSLLLGEHPDKLAARIRNVEDIDQVRANRMARTTVTAVSNEAHMESYKAHGVKRYEFRAMFNERTCTECGSLDGRIFNLDDKNPGVNFPPIHPNCRCTTGAALSKEVKDRLRQNAIKNGRDLPLRDRMTFEEWKAQSVKPASDKPAPKPKKESKPKPKKDENKSTARMELETLNVEYRPVKKFKKQPTQDEIIKRVGGPDRTEGSCSSLALAYAGNRNGLDVLDYRDGGSRTVFSRFTTVREITKISDGWIGDGVADVKVAKNLLDEHVEVGKEYYLVAGQHAAIVRKIEGEGYQYLELQHSEQFNGFKTLDEEILHDRFGCRKKGYYPRSAFLIDIDKMKNNPEIKKLLGYINTSETEQVKGNGGGIK